MYQLTNLLEEINCDILEYAYLTEDSFHGSNSFKLWVPKIMAPMPFGCPKSWNGVIGKIFLNDSACKINHSSSINFQNHISVARHQDKDFEARADDTGKLHMGQQFIVSFMNHNPKDCRIIEIM